MGHTARSQDGGIRTHAFRFPKPADSRAFLRPELEHPPDRLTNGPNKKAGHLATPGLAKGTCNEDAGVTIAVDTQTARPVGRRRRYWASVLISNVFAGYSSLPQLSFVHNRQVSRWATLLCIRETKKRCNGFAIIPRLFRVAKRTSGCQGPGTAPAVGRGDRVRPCRRPMADRDGGRQANEGSALSGKMTPHRMRGPASHRVRARRTESARAGGGAPV